MTMFFLGLLAIGGFFLIKRAGRGIEFPYQARLTGRAYRDRTTQSARRTSIAVRASLVLVNKTDQRIICAAFAAAIALAAIFGGLVPALIVVGAVIICLAPAALGKVSARRQVRRLLDVSHIDQNAPLYVPETWQNH